MLASIWTLTKWSYFAVNGDVDWPVALTGLYRNFLCIKWMFDTPLTVITTIFMSFPWLKTADFPRIYFLFVQRFRCPSSDLVVISKMSSLTLELFSSNFSTPVVVSSSILKKSTTCLWYSESACSFSWTRPENCNHAVPASIASTEACFRDLSLAWGLPFSMAHFWYGTHTSHRKLLFSKWLNWGKQSPSNVTGTSLPAISPTVTGGNDVATRVLSWDSCKRVVLLQCLKISNLLAFMTPFVSKNSTQVIFKTIRFSREVAGK